MGVLTDLVAVPLDHAQAVASSHSPAGEFEGIDAKWIDTVKLCTLKAILTGSPYQKSWLAEFHLLAAGDMNAGPWVMAVPSDLVAAIATLPEADLQATAAAWQDTEEFRADSWTVKEVDESLRDIRRLAIRAYATDTPILMWMSL